MAINGVYFLCLRQHAPSKIGVGIKPWLRNIAVTGIRLIAEGAKIPKMIT